MIQSTYNKIGLTIISIVYSGSGTVHSVIEVVDKGTLRQMRFGKRGGWQGAIEISRPDRPIFPYQRAFQALVNTVPEMTAFLSLGVGTGTSLRSVSTTHPEAILHGVEIDQVVLNLAIEFFQAPNHKQAEYWVGDGFAFIRAELPVLYDVVFVDAYMRNDIYQTALQPTVLESLAKKVTSSGMVVYNLICPTLATKTFHAFTEAAKTYFSTVIDWPVGFPFTDQNRLLILSHDINGFDTLSKRIGQAKGLNLLERFSWPMRMRRL